LKCFQRPFRFYCSLFKSFLWILVRVIRMGSRWFGLIEFSVYDYPVEAWFGHDTTRISQNSKHESCSYISFHSISLWITSIRDRKRKLCPKFERMANMTRNTFSIKGLYIYMGDSNQEYYIGSVTPRSMQKCHYKGIFGYLFFFFQNHHVRCIKNNLHM